MGIEPHEVRWILSPEAVADLSDVRIELGEFEYRAGRRAFQSYMCAYLADPTCSKPLGRSIRSLGGTAAGGKVLKVRWLVPGRGKSGGLRLCLVVFGDDTAVSKVVIARAFLRVDEPTKEEFEDAAKLGDLYAAQ